MEILKRPTRNWGRFFDLLPLGSGNRSAERSADSTVRVSLALGNEVLGNWFCTHNSPLTDVLRRAKN